MRKAGSWKGREACPEEGKEFSQTFNSFFDAGWLRKQSSVFCVHCEQISFNNCLLGHTGLQLVPLH